MSEIKNTVLYGHPTLRFATLNDVPWIVSHAQEQFSQSKYANLEVDIIKSQQMMEKFIIEGKDEYLVLISHEEGRPVGVIAAYAFAPIFSTRRIAVEVCFFIEEPYRQSKRGVGLMEAYEYWAKLVGCKTCQYGLLESSPERMKELYERRGAYATETIYMKDLT
jgi:GNAT superfamily N-acetyltransferase